LSLQKNFFSFAFLLLSISMIAQLDTIVDSNKKITGKKVIIAIPTNKLKKPTPLEINNDNGFKEAYGKKKRKDAIKKKEDDLQDKGILSAAKYLKNVF